MAFYEREKVSLRGRPASGRRAPGFGSLASGRPPPRAPAERAALTMVANVLLSLDATLTKE